jgi:hypothetical protein
MWTFCYGVINYATNNGKYDLLQSIVRRITKLEGDQWMRYINYLYGSDRIGFWYLGTIEPLTFCCYRKPHYQKLIKREYGYIVFCQDGFILDEMYFVIRNDPHIILEVKYVVGMELRINIIRKDAKYTVPRYSTKQMRQEAAIKIFHDQTVQLGIYLPKYDRSPLGHSFIIYSSVWIVDDILLKSFINKILDLFA